MKILNIVLLILKGVPFRLPKGMNWKEINTPVFPFLFSIISGGLFSTIPFKIIKGMLIRKDYPQCQIIQSFLFSMLGYSMIFLLFNSIILIFVLGFVRQFKRAARVLYFSAFFQMLIMLFLVLSDIGIFYSSPFVIIILFALRLSSAFIIMQRETDNNFLSLLYAALSLDAWFMLNIIF